MKTSKRSFSDQTTTISTASVAIASSSEEALVVDALVRAFVSDPVVRWTWPNLRAYITHFPNFIKAFGGRAFSQGSAYCTDGYAGAALWLPPGIHPDEEALNNIFQQTVSEQQQPDLFAMFEEMDHYHPDEPHWYLPLIGVVPTRQSQGCGAALMHQALLQCDRNQTPAYLEATSARSIPFYQRHGFKVLGTIQVGTSPPLFPMLRQPK